MLVSIIVPIYNIEKYIRECVDSILRQTFSDFELLLVDDGSTDSCGEICDEYALQDIRTVVIHKRNGGLVSAWKEGVSLAKGEYICFIDGDDFVAKDYLESLINQIGRNTDMVCMNCTRYYNDKNQYRQKINGLKKGKYLLDKFFYQNFIIGKHNNPNVANSRWAKLIRKEIVLNSAAYCSDEVSFGEDQQFTIGALLLCKEIILYNDYKYFYRCNPTSIVNSYKTNLWEKSKLLIKTIKNIPKIDKVENIEDQLKLQLLLYMFECFKNEEFYGAGLQKDYFINLIDECYKYKLFSVRHKTLNGIMAKALMLTSKNRAYKATKFLLSIYRFMGKV